MTSLSSKHLIIDPLVNPKIEYFRLGTEASARQVNPARGARPVLALKYCLSEDVQG